jgi:hypothetical protein
MPTEGNMTTLIRQRTNNDCVLAAIAMAAGKEKWEDAWTEEDLQAVVASRGISDKTPWLERMGFKEHTDFVDLYVQGEAMITVKAMLWNRRALLSVESLNHSHGSHMVFWDGTRIWDPNEGVDGKIAFKFLSSVYMTRLVLFK